MITIETPNDLPHGIDLRMWQVDDEAEAAKIAGTQKAYLYKSHIINAWYLFIPLVSA